MRNLAITLALALASTAPLASTARAEPRPSPARAPDERGRAMLSAGEVMRDFAFWQPEVRACYLAHAAKQRTATGRLSLELVIRPAGSVLTLAVTAPGVKGAALERCIEASAKDWHFAYAPGHTTAVIPLLFLRTRAPGAGPTSR